jgi:PAP2 superfamily
MDLAVAAGTPARYPFARDFLAAHALAAVLAGGKWVEGLVQCFAREIRRDIPSYAAILLYFSICGLYVHFSGFTIFNGLIEHYISIFKTTALLVLIPVFLFVSLFLCVYRLRHQTVPPELNVFAPQFWARFGAGIVLLAFFVLMMAAYSTVKTMLPFGRGFPYEEVVAAADAFIHSGDPWHFLHRLVDADSVGVTIDFLYAKGWMLYWIALGFWICVSGRASPVRTRYVVSLVVTWGLLGNVVAGLAKSAGPIFYERVTGDGQRFGELSMILDTLAAHGAFAKNLSDYLWAFYQERSVGVGSGISAFPSMHVAIATLNAFFIREALGRLATFLAWSYLAFILFASVYLGWHYAVDGYASIVLVTIIYWAGRKISRRLSARDQRQPAPA